ncbi:MAG: hypothetical protein R6V03_01190, partial [Kiritimatiellia bacterium]
MPCAFVFQRPDEAFYHRNAPVLAHGAVAESDLLALCPFALCPEPRCPGCELDFSGIACDPEHLVNLQIDFFTDGLSRTIANKTGKGEVTYTVKSALTGTYTAKARDPNSTDPQCVDICSVRIPQHEEYESDSGDCPPFVPKFFSDSIPLFAEWAARLQDGLTNEPDASDFTCWKYKKEGVQCCDGKLDSY